MLAEANAPGRATHPKRLKEKSQMIILKLLLKWRLQVSTSHRKNKMTLHLDRNSNRTAHGTDEQGAYPVNVSHISNKRSTTENNDNNNNIGVTSTLQHPH